MLSEKSEIIAIAKMTKNIPIDFNEILLLTLISIRIEKIKPANETAFRKTPDIPPNK